MEMAAQSSGGVPTPGGVQGPTGHGTPCSNLGDQLEVGLEDLFQPQRSCESDPAPNCRALAEQQPFLPAACVRPANPTAPVPGMLGMHLMWRHNEFSILSCQESEVQHKLAPPSDKPDRPGPYLCHAEKQGTIVTFRLRMNKQ